MKHKITFGLASSVGAMSAVVLSTVLPSPFALAQPTTPPATATPKASAPAAKATTTPPAPAAAKAPAKASAAAPAAAISTEDMVKQANDEVFKSMAERNAALYDQRVADDAVLLGFGPGIVSKFKAFPNDPDDPKVEAHRVNNMRVKLEGNTAVVVGRFWVKMAGTAKPSQGTTDFMNVFVKRDNRWQLIASHLNMSNP